MRNNEKNKAQLIENSSSLRKQVKEFQDHRVEHRPVKQKLQKSEELNRRIVEAIAAGIVQVSPDGAIVHANAEAEKIMGLSYDKLTKRHIQDWESDTIWEDGSPCSAEAYPVTKCLQTGESQPATTIGVRRPGGEVIWAILTAVPMIDADSNQASGAVLTFLDVTEHKRAEKALLENENRLRMLAAATDEGIFIHENGKIIDANQAGCKISGYAGSELIGMSGLDLVVPEAR